MVREWRELYRRRQISAEEAASKIKSGDRIVLGHACGEPHLVVDQMVSHKDRYENVEIVHMVAMGGSDYTKPDMKGHFRHNALFVGSATRDAVNDARADYTPCFFSEIPRMFRNGSLPVDVALVQLTPPDENGWCSFGVSSDYTKPAAENAKLVIAEVNDRMPRTHGDNSIHASEVDWFVECSYPITQLQPPSITDVERAIGENCASLIEDGSTIQVGIGAIPDAALLFMKDKKDLGIHSEMFSDGVVELVEAGVITNQKKTLHAGKLVATFLMGTQRLYDFVDDNPKVAMYPVNYVNDPSVIAQNEKMISINSTLEVDLMGQAASESIGLKQISGVGGQVDFVRGTSHSNGGKSIIAMPSAAAQGKYSRIVPFLREGAAVTITRNEIQYVVTEYGIAYLRGKTLRQRARELIKVAHPNFRPLLEKEYEKRFNQRI
jgi:4-hydroxybutyrate CoA-transferase